MKPSDPFQEGRETTEELRRAVESIRDDVRAVVREEVADAGLPESELRRMVSDLVREELAAARNRPPRWTAPVLVAVGAAVGLVVGVVGYRALAGPPDSGADAAAMADPPPSAGSGSEENRGAAVAPAGASAGGAGQDGRGTPEDRAARYDSLFRAGSPELDPLVADLEGRAAAPVLEALTAWRAGESLAPAPRRRLHDALVQAAVNRLAGTDLILDGLVTRNPCGGSSCTAVLRLWDERGPEWGLPTYPADPGGREARLAVVEGVLVLEGLEAAGG